MIDTGGMPVCLFVFVVAAGKLQTLMLLIIICRPDHLARNPAKKAPSTEVCGGKPAGEEQKHKDSATSYVCTCLPGQCRNNTRI
jgi:hypothetical protein